MGDASARDAPNASRTTAPYDAGTGPGRSLAGSRERYARRSKRPNAPAGNTYRLHATAMPCNALYWLARPHLALSYHDRHGCGLGKLRGAPWRHAGLCPASRLDREPDQGWQPRARRPAPQSAGDERPNRPLHGDRRQGHDAPPQARVGRDLDHRDVRQALKEMIYGHSRLRRYEARACGPWPYSLKTAPGNGLPAKRRYRPPLRRSASSRGSAVSRLPSSPRSCRLVSWAISGGSAVRWLWWSLSCRRLVSSPISGGSAVSWLLPSVSCRRLVSWAISGGSAVSWLPSSPSLPRLVSWAISGGSAVRWLPSSLRSRRLVSWPISEGSAVSWLWRSLSSRRLVSWPISGGSTVSWLPSSVRSRRLVSSPISGGSAVS